MLRGNRAFYPPPGENNSAALIVGVHPQDFAVLSRLGNVLFFPGHIATLVSRMAKAKNDILQGTLALLVLKHSPHKAVCRVRDHGTHSAGVE